MSSTNRGAERREHDFYATPEWCTKALFQRMPELCAFPLIDPCAGDGAILKVAKDCGAAFTSGIEIRDVPAPPSAQAWSIGDGLHFASIIPEAKPFSVVTNPPYSLAQEFIEAYRAKVYLSAWLLRLNFLGSQKRAEWFRRNPPARVLILPRRPSFTGGATDSCEYAWVIWDSSRPQAETKLGWLEVTP